MRIICKLKTDLSKMSKKMKIPVSSLTYRDIICNLLKLIPNLGRWPIKTGYISSRVM